MKGRLTALAKLAPLSQMEQCGRITPEQVAGMLRNDWPDCSGLGGRLQAESVAGLVRNTHLMMIDDIQNHIRSLIADLPIR
jgi:hypothetical protein